MSCTNPRYAIQWLDKGKPYPSGHRFCQLDFYNFRERLIIHNGKYKGDFAKYLEDKYLPNGYIPDVDFRPVIIPCGKCVSCKMAYGRLWSFRGLMESFFHDKSCFLTLTLNDKELVKHGRSVRIDYLQKFIKRLRKKYGKIRYLACGEYGSTNGRPHYHIIVFGFSPVDVSPFPVYSDGFNNLVSTSPTGDKVFCSRGLSSIWPYGFVSVGSVSSSSISYVAGYVVKKAESTYYKENGLTPPFITMSRKPGLGYDFLKNYTEDVVSDQIMIEDKVFQCPRYFMKLFEKHCPELANYIKSNRLKKAKECFQNNYSSNRLKVLSELADLRFKKLQRYL